MEIGYLIGDDCTVCGGTGMVYDCAGTLEWQYDSGESGGCSWCSGPTQIHHYVCSVCSQGFVQYYCSITGDEGAIQGSHMFRHCTESCHDEGYYEQIDCPDC